MQHSIDVYELLSRQQRSPDDLFLVDVREPKEHAIADLGGLLIPLNTLPQRLHEIDFNKKVIIYCHHGIRSRLAVNYLIHAGYHNVYNLEGGIDEWSEKIDHSVARY